MFDAAGVMLSQASHAIRIWRAPGGIVEQSSDDIRAAVCGSVCDAVKTANVNPARIGGIGFDATCSPMVVGQHGKPVNVRISGDSARKVVDWMDHRATDQAVPCPTAVSPAPSNRLPI